MSTRLIHLFKGVIGGLINGGAYIRGGYNRSRKSVSIKVSGKLSTFPSPKSALTLNSHLGQNVGLGEG